MAYNSFRVMRSLQSQIGRLETTYKRLTDLIEVDNYERFKVTFSLHLIRLLNVSLQAHSAKTKPSTRRSIGGMSQRKDQSR